jgi:Escherichia/Staphylococcus phage prohead protease
MPFTTKPWDGSASRWPDAAAYCASCVIDDNPPGAEKSKALCHLPIKEPDGTYNLNAIKNALSRLPQTQTTSSKATAKARLQRLLAEGGGGQSRALQPELRSVPLLELEAPGDGSTFSGYAAVFDEDADLGGFTESVSRGAFRKVLAEGRNIPMLWNHNPDKPLAMTEAGTLTLSEDLKGLRVEATLGRTSWANDLRDMLDRGEVRGMSYGFVAGVENSKIEHRADRPHRTLLGFKRLLDVSPTWDPAYASTSAELRSMTSIAVDLQQLLEGEDPQQEDGAGSTEDPEIEEARVSGSDEEPVTALDLAAAKRRLRLIDLYEKGRENTL